MKLSQNNLTSRYTVLMCAVILCLGACNNAGPVKTTESESQSSDRTKWFVDAKYGMFIHWGPYAVAGGEWEGKHYYGSGELIKGQAHISQEEYEELSRRFNPVKFDAEQWVDIARQAGMKYITITTIHSDGFLMYHSKESNFNIFDFTPFKRDPLKELSEACRKAGIKLCVYCSKRKSQLKEILTGYGPIGMAWFDGGGLTKEQAQEISDWVHSFQPDCLVSERIGHGLGEIKGFGDSEFPKEVIKEPAEAITTHNDSWGYIERDNNWKSPKEIIHHLVKCNAKGANFMLNVGPKGDGTFPEMAVAVIKNAGQWISKHEESIYGTTHSPFPELSWGECTHRPGKLYLHVLEWPDDLKLRVPSIAGNVESIRLLVGGKKLKYTRDGKDILVHLPVPCPDPVNTVIVVNYTGDLNIDPVRTLMENCDVELDAFHADISGSANHLGIYFMEEYGSWYKADLINKWSSEKDMASWEFRAPKAGLYAVELDYSYPTSSTKREGLIMIDDNEKLYFECKSTGDQRHHFQKQPVGVIRVSEPGYHKLSIRPTGEGEEFIKLRTLRLSMFE